MPQRPAIVQKIAIPLAIAAATWLAWQKLGWQGVALVISGLVLWGLLHVNRMLQVFKRTANRPVGHVDSAVMLNAKLRPGVNLLHILALTHALGERLSAVDAQPDQPEIYRWTDGGGSTVTCTLQEGRLVTFVLRRPLEEGNANPLG